MQEGGVGGDAHQAAQGVESPAPDAPWRCLADGGVAGHIADKVQREGKDRGFCPQRRRPAWGGLDAGMARADHNHVIAAKMVDQNDFVLSYQEMVRGGQPSSGRTPAVSTTTQRRGWSRVVVNRQRFPALQVGGGVVPGVLAVAVADAAIGVGRSCTGSPRDAARSSKSGGPASRPQCGRWSGCRGPAAGQRPGPGGWAARPSRPPARRTAPRTRRTSASAASPRPPWWKNSAATAQKTMPIIRNSTPAEGQNSFHVKSPAGLFAHTEGGEYLVDHRLGGVLAGEVGQRPQRVLDADARGVQAEARIHRGDGLPPPASRAAVAAASCRRLISAAALGSRLAVPSSRATASDRGVRLALSLAHRRMQL